MGEIEPYAAVAILDLDNPKVWIIRRFALQPLVGLPRLDPFRLVRPDEGTLDAPLQFARHRLRGRPVEGGLAVQAIDFDEDGASFRRAPAAEHRALALRAAPAQIGRDPDVGPQAHFLSARLASRGRLELLDQPRRDVGREGQSVRAFEIVQRLMGRGAFVSVRLDRVAEFDERSLRGQNEMRIVRRRFAAQPIADFIGRARMAPAAQRQEEPCGWRRRGSGGRRGLAHYVRGRRWGNWNCVRWRRRGPGRRGREQWRGMALGLQDERIHPDADQERRQACHDIDSGGQRPQSLSPESGPGPGWTSTPRPGGTRQNRCECAQGLQTSVVSCK